MKLNRLLTTDQTPYEVVCYCCVLLLLVILFCIYSDVYMARIFLTRHVPTAC